MLINRVTENIGKIARFFWVHNLTALEHATQFIMIYNSSKYVPCGRMTGEERAGL